MTDEEIRNNLIVNLTLEFSILILTYCEELEKTRKYTISNQLTRSGTSIGANVWEAQNAESKKDFIHKIKIAAKEMEETKYWLLLCQKFKNCPDPIELINKIEIIQRVITKIIKSSIKALQSKKKDGYAKLTN